MPLCMRCDELTVVDFDDDGTARCGVCGTEAARRSSLPLFVVTGVMGAGKSTLVPELRRRLPECLVFDGDTLLSYFDDQDRFRGAWLMVAAAIAEHGRPTVLCTFLQPAMLDAVGERSWWPDIRYLNLDCRDEELARRLRARPAWRGSHPREDYIADRQRDARWMREHLPLTVDTTDRSVSEVAEGVAKWVKEALRS